MTSNNLWHVYIVRCSDGTLYTGIAIDLKKRITEHNSDKGGSKYTRSRKPVQLVYYEEVRSRASATRREYQLKRMPLARKKNLISSYNNVLMSHNN